MNIFILTFLSTLLAAAPEAPTGLLTDLLADTEFVFAEGFVTDLTLETLNPDLNQWAEIRTVNPSFSWEVRDGRTDVTQTAYQIQLAKTRDFGAESLVFDSGKVESEQSVSVFLPENAPKLHEGGVYYWRVRTWNNGSESPWSEVKGFRIGKDLKPGEVSRYPIHKEVETPVLSEKRGETVTFFDFGRAAFGQIRLTVDAPADGTILVRLGERVKDGAVDRKPAGTTRFWEYTVPVQKGVKEYAIQTRRDVRNSSGAAFLMPAYIGEVMPFRYAEVEPKDGLQVKLEKVERLSAFYHFDEARSRFHCSDERLNQVWDLCKYSIKATSFLGVYVDGDRERIPYEGDALLNQLSHYSTDREYTMARFSWEYLISHPTWPTEWNLQCDQMAWYDFLYTGDSRGIEKLYDELKHKSLVALAEPNGLISTRKGKVTPEFLRSIHFSGGGFRDIVDWPHKGLAGNENAASGETDGFVFQDFNAVVNAYHFFALNSMLRFAEILGKTEDAAFFKAQIAKVYAAYQTVFFDPARGVYRDGESTDHASLHGNFFPLAFGLVPDEHRKSVTEFVKSRGMRCSVYGAQFLLDAVYNGFDGAYGLERMTADDLRGWLNMIRVGSTISLEAWDDRYKPNQDWNHAWGAAPANIIPRKLVGVEPLEPGCAKLRVQPQPAGLEEFEAEVPTIRGSVSVAWTQNQKTVNQNQKADGAQVVLTVEIPANVHADVYVPLPAQIPADGALLQINGEPTDAPLEKGFFVLKNCGSGRRTFTIQRNE